MGESPPAVGESPVGHIAAGLIAGGLFASGLNAAPRLWLSSAYQEFKERTVVYLALYIQSCTVSQTVVAIGRSYLFKKLNFGAQIS